MSMSVGLEVGAGPEVRGRTLHERLVVERALVPAHALGDRGADRLDVHRGLLHVAGEVLARHDDRDRAVARHVAVVETERRGDRARVHVVVHRERFLVDRPRRARRVLARVQRDPAQRLLGGAEAVEVRGRLHARSSWPPTTRRTACATACRRRCAVTAAAAEHARLLARSLIAARCLAAYVASQTVRKHRT